MGGHNGMQAHGVVQAGLDVAGAVGSCPVEIRNLHYDGLGTALEVGTYGSDKNTELKLLGGLDADDGVGADHKGS